LEPRFNMKYKHLFGPVASRRLGVSLGVDLVPYKYCPLNCVYCEIQSTTHLEIERHEFFPPSEILGELDGFLSSNPHLDYITFSGAGEPTLNSSIKQIIRYIKETYPQYKLALLTNGTLLNRDDVLMEILPCDVILPSLDAASNEIYQKVNRPHPSLNIDDLIDGLIKLRKLYNGDIWLEVFIVPNVTDTAQELDRLRSAIAKISPDLVQLNSLDRPGAEEWVRAADPQRLKQIRSYMQEGLSMPVDIIAKIEYQPEMDVLDTDLVDIIKSTISRRPSTVEDLAASLGIHINEISRVMRELNKQGKLKTERKPQGVFYKWIA